MARQGTRNQYATLRSRTARGEAAKRFFFALISKPMAELVACLHDGEVAVLGHGQAAHRLESPYLELLAARGEGRAGARIVSVTRGRTSGELCYAIHGQDGSAVFAQVPGSGK